LDAHSWQGEVINIVRIDEFVAAVCVDAHNGDGEIYLLHTVLLRGHNVCAKEKVMGLLLFLFVFLFCIDHERTGQKSGSCYCTFVLVEH
jgi:hypothetical protein